MDDLFKPRVPDSEMDDGEKHGYREDGYPDTPKYKYGGQDVRIVYDRKQREKAEAQAQKNARDNQSERPQEALFS
mgnify:CR=1 FL=1